jgi:large subunit ribosomal protein L18
MLEKQEKRYRRHRKIRAKISGTVKIPRLCVFRSAKHIYGQLIDDEMGKTILNVNDLNIKKSSASTKISNKAMTDKPEGKEKSKDEKAIEMTNKVALAFKVGKLIAEKAVENKIVKVVFDRGGYKYHGRVKALAEGAREGGLKF